MENFDDFKPVVENFDDFAPVKPEPTLLQKATTAIGKNMLDKSDIVKGIIGGPTRLLSAVDSHAVALANKLGGNAHTAVPELHSALPVPNTPSGQFGSIIGDVATTLPATAAIPLKVIPQVLGNAGLAVAQGRPEDVGSNLALGGIIGGATHGLASGLPKSKAAQELLKRGVTLTPGQAVDKKTVTGQIAHGIEQMAGSNPISAPFVRNAQRRALDEANVAAAQAVVKHVDDTIKLGHPPREAIEKTRDLISDAYTNSLDGINIPRFVLPEENMVKEIASSNPMMDDAQIAQMVRFTNNRISSMSTKNRGVIDGTMIKQLDSEIGQHIRNLSSSTNAADKTAAPAWRDLQANIRDLMSQSQPDKAKRDLLSSANTAYRQLLTLEKALLSGADNFTPRQLGRTLDKAGIKGTELNTISNAMKETLPNTIPNSGTAERLIGTMLPAALMGGGYGANELGYPTVGAGMALAGALGSKTGSKAMLGNTAVQRGLKKVSPQAAAATVAALRGKRDDER